MMSRDKTLTAPFGPAGYPILGHLPDFLRDKLGFLSRCAAQYGEVVKLRIGEPTFLLNNPEDIKHVLVINPDNYDKSPRLTSQRGKRLSGDGLLTSIGAAHLKQRRMMQPVFYRKSIESFAETITSGVEQMLAGWKHGLELNIAREMMELAQHNIIKTIFGMDFDDRSGALAGAITTRKQYMEHVFFSPFPEFFPSRIGREYRKAMDRIDGTIDRAIRERRGSAVVPNNLLSLLVHATYDDGTGMTDKQVGDEARTLLITGYETIGEALAWTWYLLARHQEVEAKLLAEVDDVLKGRPPRVEDVPKLCYTGMALAESMRLYPPTWIFIRMARQGDALPSGVAIPAGSKLYLCQYVMHRNPRYFPQPERFDPERFSEAAKKERPQFAYFPFGGGARVCIGESFAKMEGVLVLASIVQRFKLALAPGQTIVPEAKMTLRPKNGILMQVHRRKTA
jgi:cytochrome P450